MINASTILPLFILPLGLIGLSGVFALLCLVLNKISWAKFMLVFQLLVFWLCSMPIFSGYMASLWERQYLPTAISDSPTADVAVILGGVLKVAMPPGIETNLSGAVDRVYHAFKLLNAGKVKKIIIVGDSVQWKKTGHSEAKRIKHLLISWGGVPDSIVVADRSLNTYENALETKEVFAALNVSSALLVTSAMHMPRAYAAFQTAGINVIASPTDYETVNRKGAGVMSYLPDVKALMLTTFLFREIMGFVYYKLQGWIN